MIIIIATLITLIIPFFNITSLNEWILITSNNIITHANSDEKKTGLFDRLKKVLSSIGSFFLKHTTTSRNKNVSASLSGVVLLYLLLLFPILLMTVIPFYVAYFLIISISPNAKKIDDAFEKGKDFGRENSNQNEE